MNGATKTPTSAVTRVNEQLRLNGRAERLVRGRGYFYLRGGEASILPESGVYSYSIGRTERDFVYAWGAVTSLFSAAGIDLKAYPSKLIGSAE